VDIPDPDTLAKQLRKKIFDALINPQMFYNERIGVVSGMDKGV